MAKAIKIEPRTIEFAEYIVNQRKAGDFATNEEIARVIGVKSKTSITEILGKRSNIQPEQWKKFKTHFHYTSHGIGTEGTDNSVSRETHTEALIVSLKERIQEHKDRISEEKRILEKHNDFLQDIVKTNLTGLATGQRLIRAQVRAIHQWDAHMAAKGDPKKEESLLKQMGKRINDNFLESHEGDIPAENGK